MKLSLCHKVLIGMFLGLLGGKYLPWLPTYVEPMVEIYMNLIKMIVIPTVFCAILYGITNLSDVTLLGRLGKKAAWIYLGMTILAVSLGILIVNLLKPGIGVNLMLDLTQGSHPSVMSIKNLLVGIFPKNPIMAMAQGNTLQVVFFAFIVGISIILTGEKAKTVKQLISSITSVVFKMVELIVKITPYGVFATMAWVVAHYGFTSFVSLGKLALTILFAFAIQYLIFGLMLLICHLNPLPFFKKSLNVQSLAFASSSSKASIALAIDELHNKLGVSSESANFVLPLGAAINMSGSAIYITVCTLFLAQMLGITLTFYQYVILMLTSTIGSIGAAGYPSGAVIMLGMVLNAVGLPEAIIPLILGIDRFLDMFRTVVNVTGDCAATVVVDHLEGTLDQTKYDDSL